MSGNKTNEKTNCTRKLDSMKIPYKEMFFETETALSGIEVASLLGLDQERVFKTLVTTGKTGEHYVFMIPVAEELDLRKAAAAVGEKSIEMLKSKDLFTLTGYVHGGCSPIGMKKVFRTTVDETAMLFDEITFSGGRIGYQISLPVDVLQQVVQLKLFDLTK